MKFLCKNNFWGGKSGNLYKTKQSGTKLVFKVGKKYDLVSLPKGDPGTGGLKYLTIFAMGEDRKLHAVFHQEVSKYSLNFIKGAFDFSSLEKDVGNKNMPFRLLFQH